jgi:hypothetical protein
MGTTAIGQWGVHGIQAAVTKTDEVSMPYGHSVVLRGDHMKTTIIKTAPVKTVVRVHGPKDAPPDCGIGFCTAFVKLYASATRQNQSFFTYFSN